MITIHDDPIEERIDGPTPNGGIASVIYYRDDRGDSTRKSLAVQAEIHELGAHGQVIQRTYMTFRPGTPR